MLAGAWLRTSKMEISAKVREVVAHQRRVCNHALQLHFTLHHQILLMSMHRSARNRLINRSNIAIKHKQILPLTV